MNRNDVLKQITEKRLELKALERKLHEESREVFERDVLEFFIEHPVVESLSFTQYTPYFNDGDVCTFLKGDPELVDATHAEWPDEKLYTDVGPDPKYTYSRKYRIDPNPAYTDAHRAAEEAIQLIWRGYESDQFEGMYGDHVKVRFTRGTRTPEIDEYTDHD